MKDEDKDELTPCFAKDEIRKYRPESYQVGFKLNK